MIIKRDGKNYRAATCPRCGGKIWPAAALLAHKDRHEARDYAVRVYFAPIVRRFKTMRDL